MGQTGGDRRRAELASADVADIMTGPDTHRRSRLKGIWRALKQFLFVPLLMVFVFLIIAVVLQVLERTGVEWIEALQGWLRDPLFADSATTGAFLEVVGGGMITLTSITISMLLLVLQQTSSTMGNMVYDQFLTRRRNQVYIGFIVGATVLPIFLRTTVSPNFNPVLGAAFTLLVLILALIGLVWFLYMTIDQMRPTTVVTDIYDRTRTARQRHARMVQRTRRASESHAPLQAVLRTRRAGYVTHINLDAIAESLKDEPPGFEIIVHAPIGSYLSHYEPMAEVKAQTQESGRRIATAVGHAYFVEQRRQLDDDPGYGLKQLEMIGWTEVSTATDNPETGLIVTRALTDLTSRWALGTDEVEVEVEKRPVPVVYQYDVLAHALDVLESMAVVSSESMQHQIFVEVLFSFAVFYPWLPTGYRARVDDILRRAVSAMGDHVMTHDLEKAVDNLVHVLRVAGSDATAHMLEEAGERLEASVGQLGNRSTRVKAGG